MLIYLMKDNHTSKRALSPDVNRLGLHKVPKNDVNIFGKIFDAKESFRNVFWGETFIRNKLTILFQIFYELVIYSKIIRIRIVCPDDSCQDDLYAQMG